MNKIEQKEKIISFISEAKIIENKEHKNFYNQGILMPDYIGGPLCDAWLNNINIFTKRYLTDHPLYNKIQEVYDYKNSKFSTFEDMLSLLISLSNDDEYWTNKSSNKTMILDNIKNENFSFKIFISHRTSDKDFVDIFVNFLVSIGVSYENVFCSSLPGCDVQKNISDEIKDALNISVCNIVILSKEYYNSPYCLNECGIIWFLDSKGIPVIPIGLEDISVQDMKGFLNSNFKLRKLNNANDLDYIYDTLNKIGVVTNSTRQMVSNSIDTIKERYNTLLRKSEKKFNKIDNKSEVYTTDDERILIYYITTKKKRKILKSDFINWIYDNELFDVDIDNAIDLISKISQNSINDNCLELGLDYFKTITSYNDSQIEEYFAAYSRHQILSKNTILKLFKNNELDDKLLLFISYIVDNKYSSFGDRWLENTEIENIKKWEFENELDSVLSSNYSYCLSYFINNKLVFPSSFTSYGNPREYSLYNSIKDLLFDENFEYIKTLQDNKQKYVNELPF